MTKEQMEDKKLWFSAMIKYFQNEVKIEIEKILFFPNNEKLSEQMDYLIKMLSWKKENTSEYDTKKIFIKEISTISNGVEHKSNQQICQNFDGTLMEVANDKLWSHAWYRRIVVVCNIISDLLRQELYHEEGYDEEGNLITKDYIVREEYVTWAKEYFNGWEKLTLEECKKRLEEVYNEAYSKEVIEGKNGIFKWLEQRLSNDDIFI